MLMKYLLILIMFASVSAYASGECPLNGYWQSNEKMTVESLYSSKTTTQNQREILGKDFFGKLVVFIECNQFTSALDGWSETTEYEIVSIGKDQLVIRYIEFPDDIKPTDKEIQIHGNCYSIPINGGQFREYMCKSSKAAFNKQRNSDSSADAPPPVR